MDYTPTKQSKIYKAETDELRRAALFSELTAKSKFVQTAAIRKRISLYDFEAVKERSAEYIESCRKSESIPTVVGLAAAFGISRQWLNQFMRDHPEHPTAEFLETVKSAFADILINLSLGRHISEATTIFVLKNCADFVDKVEIEAHPTESNAFGPVPDRAALEAKFADIVIDEAFEDSAN